MKVKDLIIQTIDKAIIIETRILTATGTTAKFARWIALKREGTTDYSLIHVFKRGKYED